MKKRIVALAVIVLIIGLITPLFAVDDEFTILWLNDTHTHLFPYNDTVKNKQYGGAARWKTIVDEVTAEVGKPLLFHAGDFFSGSDSNYLVEHKPNWERLPHYGYRGVLDIDIFNWIGMDAVCFGNHEFDYGLPWTYRVLEKADFSILAANVQINPVPETNAYKDADLTRDWAIFERNGIRVAAIGLTTDNYNKTSQVRITRPGPAVEKALAEIGDQADVVVVISHLGYGPDKALAAEVDGIDIIVGGHSHTTLPEIIKVGNTYIGQTGEYGTNIGRMDVVVKDSKVVDVKYRLIPSDFSVPQDPEIVAWLEEKLDLGWAPQTYQSGLSGLSSMGKLVTDVLLEQYDGDVALFTSRLAMGTLPAGQVTPETFYTVFWPYKMRSLGPEKDLLPSQFLDVVFGRVPRIARQFLPQADWVTNIVTVQIPAGRLDDIHMINDIFEEMDDYFQISAYPSQPANTMVTLVTDLQSYRMLYEYGLISESDPYTVHDLELFEVMFNHFKWGG